MADPIVVFFDIGDTLAIPEFSSSGSLQKLNVLPFVPDVLHKLAGSHCRLGIISNTGNETKASLHTVLSQAGLLQPFEPVLLLFSSVEGKDKKQPAFFALAAQRAGVPPKRCIYVGEDEAERTVAKSAGFQVSFHPLHVFHVVKQLS
jgi:FMN phosphatase YigB (HAD superfamily)